VFAQQEENVRPYPIPLFTDVAQSPLPSDLAAIIEEVKRLAARITGGDTGGGGGGGSASTNSVLATPAFDAFGHAFETE
jgi:hypothetical protein